MIVISSQNELVQARRRGRTFLISIFVFSIFFNLLQLVGPLFMLQVYDRVLASGSEATLVALFALVVALYGVMAVLDFGRGRLLARVGARIQEALDSRLFRASLRRSAHTGETAKTKEALGHMDLLQNALSSPAFLAFFDLPWSPIFFAALFIFHPLLGWLGLASGVILLFLTLVNQLLSSKKMKEQKQVQAFARLIGDQSVLSADTAQSLGMSSNLSARWKDSREKSQSVGISYSDISGFFQSLTKSTRMLLQSTMLAAGAWLVLKGELSAGAMIAGTILLGRALAPIEQALGQWRQLQSSRTAWNELNSFLKDNPDEPRKTELPRPTARLQVKELTVRPPGAEKPTVGGISFEVQPGQALGIVGKSGSGKTTIIRAIVGLWFPVMGEVRLNGAKLDQYESELLGSYFGYLPQVPRFFSGTIAENIARMALEPDEKEVVRAAKAAHVHELILTLPKGYDTRLDGDALQLSGGQCQRIGLARALYGDPEVYVFDEPNSALDMEGSHAFNEAVKGLKQAGKAIIISTHRPTALGVVDNLLLIDGGVTQIYGTRDEVIEKLRQGMSTVANQGAEAVREKLKPAVRSDKGDQNVAAG